MTTTKRRTSRPATSKRDQALDWMKVSRYDELEQKLSSLGEP